MRAIQRLLLLAEFVLLARCQQKPQVQISPPLEKIFRRDLILLRCGVSTDSEVTWYVNDTVQAQRNHTLKIEAAAPEHSGRYQCQHGNGPKSDDYPTTVLDQSKPILIWLVIGVILLVVLGLAVVCICLKKRNTTVGRYELAQKGRPRNEADPLEMYVADATL